MIGMIAIAASNPGDGTERGAGQSPMTDIHDIKPLLDVGDAWPWLLILFIGVAVLILALWLVWWWKRQQRGIESRVAQRPAMPPDEEALSALDSLAAQAGLAPRTFYFRLSAILRRYVERRYGFPAAEMTTEELMPHMDRLELERTVSTAFREFCEEADPIKFAGAKVDPERIKAQLSFCRDFVKKTREKPQESAT